MRESGSPGGKPAWGRRGRRGRRRRFPLLRELYLREPTRPSLGCRTTQRMFAKSEAGEGRDSVSLERGPPRELSERALRPQAWGRPPPGRPFARPAEPQAPAAQAEGALRLCFGVHSGPLLCAPWAQLLTGVRGGGGFLCRQEGHPLRWGPTSHRSSDGHTVLPGAGDRRSQVAFRRARAEGPWLVGANNAS